MLKQLLTGVSAVGLGVFTYLKLGEMPFWLVVVVLGLCVLSIILYPLCALTSNYSKKAKLGWKGYTKSSSSQQAIDDNILIGVGVGALIILGIACHLIVNS